MIVMLGRSTPGSLMGSFAVAAILHSVNPGIQRVLRRGVHASLRRIGLDIVRYDADHFPELRVARALRDRAVTLVLDVGANDGTWVRRLRATGYRGRVVSFEPQSTAFATLERASAGDPDWECRRVALGGRQSEVVLHLAGNSSSSSVLDMAPQHLASAPESRFVGDELVDMVRLDGIAGDLLQPDDRVYLKVDVQGSELEVLRGAETTLARVELVQAELSLVPLYDGAPRFDDVIEHLAQRGFGVLSVEPAFVDPRDGRLLQVDAVFGRWANGPSVSSPA